MKFESNYAQLPNHFYQALGPTTFPKIELYRWNDALGFELGIERKKYSDSELAKIFSGSEILPGMKPLAQAYSGHQFGQFNPRLGDGRALLLGELRDSKGLLRDIHLKGSGPTQFSRRGDGKANLAAVIREYIVSEAFFHLNIPASRSLALILTGETVTRESDQPGAILVRVAASHVRVGTFEHFISKNDVEGARTLANHVIDRLFPEISQSNDGYIELFEKILIRQAQLVAKWMNVGFIHGVMNTDNTFVSGETLDFGPCAFMEAYDPQTVFSSIDHGGRYAYGNQPSIMQWNLAVLAQCFFQIVDHSDKEAVKKSLVAILESYEKHFQKAYMTGLAEKFGFFDLPSANNLNFNDFFEHLKNQKIDFTLAFRKLSQLLTDNGVPQEFQNLNEDWISNWKALLSKQNKSTQDVMKLMTSVNPAYIPRNHRVEEAIQFALRGDSSKFDRLVQVISDPYNERPEFSEYLNPAQNHERVETTFCNT